MDEINILAQSIVKIEEIKEDPDWFLDETAPTELHEPSFFKTVVKKEEDEEEVLESPAAVFLEDKDVLKEEVWEEPEQDPLAISIENSFVSEPAVTHSLIPVRSKTKYEKEYKDFQHWRQWENIDKINETVMLAYAKEKSKTYSYRSLRTKFSMLKQCLLINKNVDITRFRKLYLFLRQKSEDRKSKILSEEHITKFLLEASDYIWLLKKVIIIFAIFGACRRDELVSLTVDDIETTTNGVLVTVKCKNTKKTRMFVIPQVGFPFNAYDLYKKYADLRPSDLESRRFFIAYRDGKCSKHVVGMHTIGGTPKSIAEFLNLDSPKLYTGHCFQLSFAPMLVENSGDLLSLKEIEIGNDHH